jgi:hypothetical protein
MNPAVGQSNPFSDASEYNSLAFIIARALDEVQTVSIAQVKAVDTDAQTVDILVLVNLVTGAGIQVPHGVISGRPYFRAQGGTSGIILDPAVDDIGIVVFGSRDLTAVISSKGIANPGSQRKFSWSDGIYLGGVLNTTPTQYLQFTTGGINLVSPTAITLTSPDNTVNGPLNVTGLATFQDGGVVDGNLMVTATVLALTVSATNVDATNLNVSSGGSISFPAGSLPNSVLAASGVTAGSYTNANITVDAAGVITAAASGTGGGGTLSITDGVHTVTGVTGLTVSGGTVGGSTPNATLTIAASGGTVTNVSIHNSDGNLSVSVATPTTTPALEIDLSSAFAAALAVTAGLAASALQSISIATGTGLTGGPLGASGSTVALGNTAVTAGTYANPIGLTVNAQGQITAIASGGAFMPGASWGSATGSPITLTGILPVPRPIGAACTIKEVLILTTGGTGSCTIAIWKANLSAHYPPVIGDDITGGVPPAISAGVTYRNSTLSGWTTTIAQDDVLYFTLTATSTFTSVAIFIRYG